jgi:triosephosphate isomerase (TIM)
MTMADKLLPLIAGNWKMNGLKAAARGLARDIAERARTSRLNCDIALCPPAPLLHLVADAIEGAPMALGAQDCHPEPSGPHTGDVSAEMLADTGCRYVIVGHSERRAEHGETDALVGRKAAAAHRAKLVAIVCIGETLAERDGGKTIEVVTRQLKGSLPETATAANTVIAYEPVWAIGTGRTATAQQIAEVHARIRADAPPDIRILYGGSVNAGNAREILAVKNVNGALVGGASLKANDFWAIVQSVPQ